METCATLAILGELADQLLKCQVQTPSKTNLANGFDSRHRAVNDSVGVLSSTRHRAVNDGVGVLRASSDGTIQ